MSIRRWQILAGSGLVALTLIAAIAISYWPDSRPQPRVQPRIQPQFDQSQLTHETSIVGSWKRISLADDDSVHGWRRFNASGKMAVLYGDVIYRGSYKILDKKSIETKYELFSGNGKLYQWTFGFHDGKLIMIHNEFGWVEAYESVPPETLQPSVDP